MNIVTPTNHTISVQTLAFVDESIVSTSCQFWYPSSVLLKPLLPAAKHKKRSFSPYTGPRIVSLVHTWKELMDLDLFTEQIKKRKGDLSLLKSAFQEAPGVEGDNKLIFEQSLRGVMRDHVRNQVENEVENLAALVVTAVNCAEEGLCYYSAPFLLLSDAFDCITVDLRKKFF